MAAPELYIRFDTSGTRFNGDHGFKTRKVEETLQDIAAQIRDGKFEGLVTDARGIGIGVFKLTKP